MGDYHIVGKSVQRKDVLEKVTGAAVYGADVNFPRQLYAAVCRSPLPHARILSIDAAEAKKVPGVKVVLTGIDIPGLYGQFIEDQPVMAFEKVRYEGEPVAAVAAEDLDAAMEAVKLIKVKYDSLEPVLDTTQALSDDAPLVHEDWSKYKMSHAATPKAGTNICDHFRLIKGDIGTGFKESDVVVENVYDGKMIQHVTIENHCATALYNEKGLTVWTPAQSPFMLREQLCRLFNLSMSKVRLICTHLGGAFGNKYELRAEPLAAALAVQAPGRPVKLVFSRHEEFLASGVRGASRVHIKTGAKFDGRLVSQQIKIYWDAGAYVTTSPRVSYNAGYAAGSPYRIPNVSVDSYTVVTNKQLATAYRGFGVPEVVWAYENQMDLLAQKLNMDPLELRLVNALDDGDESASGEILKSVGLKDCLRDAAELIDWANKPKSYKTPEGRLRGRGIACFCKLTGTPSSSSVVIKLNEDGTVTVLQSGTDMGQGANTVIPQIVAEAIGISVDKVTVCPIDTLYTPYEKTTTSSRLTFHVGNAALKAVDDMKEQIKNLASIAWKIEKEKIEIEDGLIKAKDNSGMERIISLEDIGKSGIMKEQEPVVGHGSYSTSDIFDPPNKETHHSKRPTIMWFWGAQAAEVEVDPETGKVEVLKVSAAHDIGKAINPLGCCQQIEGGVLMGIGSALLEEMIHENGILRNGNMVDYKIPTSKDAGLDLKISLVESHPHPEGPFGAKGIGEPGMSPTAAAIGSAVSNAIGVRLKSLPIKADDVLKALNAKNHSTAHDAKEGENAC